MSLVVGLTKDYEGLVDLDPNNIVVTSPSNQLSQAELTSAILSTDTTIPVTTTYGFSPSGQVRIENELINYTSITPIALLGATRGVDGTTAAGHAINIAVQQFLKRIRLFANAAGNDNSGDGSANAPFKSFRRLCDYIAEQVALSNWNGIILGDITGLGKEILPAEYTLPPFLMACPNQTPIFPVGVFLPNEGGVNFFATPTTLDTVTDANIPCKVTDNPLGAGATTANVVDTIGFPAVAATAITDAPLTATATTVNVTSTVGFPTSGLLKTENEIIAYSGVTGTSFTGCVRGVNGTAAAVHVATTAIAQVNIIKIDNELIAYSGITGTSFTGLNRGSFGTTGAAHVQNTRVLLSQEDGLVSYVTNLTLANRQGKFIMGSANGQFACIANNTTGPNSIIEVPSTANFTAPFTIGDPTAEINRNTATPRSPVLQLITAGQSNLTFAGVKFTDDVSPGTNGIEQTVSSIVNFNMCDFDVAFNCVRALFPTISGCIFRRQVRSAGALGIATFNCVFLSCALRQAGAFKIQYNQCILDGCTPVGQGGDFIVSATKGNPAPIGVQIQNCRIRNGSSHGILMESGGKGFVLNTSVKGCVGSGVKIDVPGLLNLTAVAGYGNAGNGVFADDGGRLKIDDNATFVSGASGDIKAGNMAARTYADFRANAPIKNQFDVPGFTGATADTATGARVWQP